MSQTISMYFTHALDFLKGWPSPSAVDYDLFKDSGELCSPVYGGRVVHVDPTSGKYKTGAVGTQMPIFLINGETDFDVQNVSAPAPNGWTAISPTGKQSGLVAIGGYELQSTEYDPNGTFAPNAPLHSPVNAQITSGTDYSMCGMLYAQRNWPGGNAGTITAYTDHICAIVSRLPGTNSNRVPVISFWPYFLPGGTANE